MIHGDDSLRLRRPLGVRLNTGLRAATLLSFSLVVTSIAVAQATPAATQNLHLSAFGGVTGSYTGLEGSRNLGITAGADVGFRSFYHLYPSLEVRGTYPVANGAIAGERNFLGGLKLEHPYRLFHPYGDVLFGRNKIEYEMGGYPNSTCTCFYVDTIANILSFGGGVDIDLTPHFAAKFDGQFQRYETPVTASGAIYAKAFTAGIVYRLDFNRHFHYDRKTGLVTNLPKESTPPPPKAPPAPPPPPPDAATPASAPDAPATPTPTPDPGTPAPPVTAPAPDATPPPPPAPAPDSTTPPPTPAPDSTIPPAPPTQQPQ
jgi:hypothetical protein